MIRTASQSPLIWTLGGYRRFVESQAKKRWPAGQFRVNWTPRGPLRARAFVVRASWVARCPTCPEALLIEPGEPFWCPNCLCVANGGQAWAVEWPADRDEIERLLSLRPDPETRNWLPHETAADLARENAEHGIGG